MEHGKNCFARLVRLLLGSSAIAIDKLEHGASLCILGMLALLFFPLSLVHDGAGVDVHMSRKGFSWKPTESKVRE